MNLLIHRIALWLTVATILAGLGELYLLCDQWLVIYSIVQIVLSLWLFNCLDGHIYDIKVQRRIRYWDKVYAQDKVAKARVTATR